MKTVKTLPGGYEMNQHLIEFVVRGRQQGKTTELARWAKEDSSRLLIVATHSRKSLLREYGVPADQLVAFAELPLRGRQPSAVAIDGLEEVLFDAVGHTVDVVSINDIVVR